MRMDAGPEAFSFPDTVVGVASPGLVVSIWTHLETYILTWAPILFMALICFVLWRTMKLMPRTKPQQIRPESKSSIGWGEVAGADEAKAELQEVVEFLREPERFTKLGAKVPKGILLHGPPGTGKTLLAKAVAKESGAEFFSQSAAAFVEMFAGLGAARIRRLFAEARAHRPAVVFIDEIDAVGGERGSDNNSEREQIEQQDFDSALERVVAGMQSRRTLNEHERRVVAFHEAGHALCAELHPGVNRVHKISIVPRGRALGYTLNLPDEDRYLKTREELIDHMTVLLGGRVAEEIVFGAVTTGASNDLHRVAEISRAMIHEYAMGTSITSRKVSAHGGEVSDRTRELRDDEQQHLADEAKRAAERLITMHRDKLDELAAALLRNEVLERADIDRIMAGTSRFKRT